MIKKGSYLIFLLFIFNTLGYNNEPSHSKSITLRMGYDYFDIYRLTYSSQGDSLLAGMTHSSGMLTIPVSPIFTVKYFDHNNSLKVYYNFVQNSNSVSYSTNILGPNTNINTNVSSVAFRSIFSGTTQSVAKSLRFSLNLLPYSIEIGIGLLNQFVFLESIHFQTSTNSWLSLQYTFQTVPLNLSLTNENQLLNLWSQAQSRIDTHIFKLQWNPSGQWFLDTSLEAIISQNLPQIEKTPFLSLNLFFLKPQLKFTLLFKKWLFSSWIDLWLFSGGQNFNNSNVKVLHKNYNYLDISLSAQPIFHFGIKVAKNNLREFSYEVFSGSNSLSALNRPPEYFGLGYISGELVNDFVLQYLHYEENISLGHIWGIHPSADIFYYHFRDSHFSYNASPFIPVKSNYSEDNPINGILLLIPGIRVTFLKKDYLLEYSFKQVFPEFLYKSATVVPPSTPTSPGSTVYNKYYGGGIHKICIELFF